MAELISYQRSAIPACDVESLYKLAELVEATVGVSGIAAYKLGAIPLTITDSLTAQVKTVRRYNKTITIIYDHQKGGTDIPELGSKFAKAVKKAGADAAILFPFAGAATERSWITACKAEGIEVLVGGHMTQAEFLETEGGFIAATGPEGMYRIAADNGVTNFVVPGNKVEYVKKYREFLEKMLGAGNFVLYAPGFISQGGDITETGKEAGGRWHAIVGSAIYNQDDMEAMREVAEKLTAQIMARGGL